MSLQITDNAMSSDVIGATALFEPDAAADGNGAWVLSWVPLRLFTRNQAVTGMQLAETVAQGGGEEDGQVKMWAAELHLTPGEAVDRIRRAAGADR